MYIKVIDQIGHGFQAIHGCLPVVLWGNFSYPNSRDIGKDSTASLPRSCAIQIGLLSIYQHKRDAFGWICINRYPNVFLRRWGGCLVIPQRRWGPLGPHTTTVYTRRSSLVSHFYLYTIIVRQTSVEVLCCWGYPIHWQFMTWGPNNMGANAALHIWHIAFRCIEMKKLLML